MGTCSSGFGQIPSHWRTVSGMTTAMNDSVPDIDPTPDLPLAGADESTLHGRFMALRGAFAQRIVGQSSWSTAC
jgi:hypothetical protein